MTADKHPRDSTTDTPHNRPVDAADATVSANISTAQHEGEGESFAVTVLKLLAEVFDTDVVSMSPRLADVIDPEILVRLRQTADQPEQTFTFTYQDCAVTVTNHGFVSVRHHLSHDSP